MLHRISVVMSTLRSKLIIHTPVAACSEGADRQADARIEARHRHRQQEADRRSPSPR